MRTLILHVCTSPVQTCLLVVHREPVFRAGGMSRRRQTFLDFNSYSAMKPRERKKHPFVLTSNFLKQKCPPNNKENCWHGCSDHERSPFETQAASVIQRESTFQNKHVIMLPVTSTIGTKTTLQKWTWVQMRLAFYRVRMIQTSSNKKSIQNRGKPRM